MQKFDTKTAASILGVPVDAKMNIINKSWRQIARTCHPDLHPNNKKADKKYRQLSAAYTILSNANEGTRRMRSLEEDMVENEFDKWIKTLSPEKQKEIHKDLENFETDE